MTFNQYQKTLHLSYHTCMYLKVDISIVGLGSVRLMSLLNYTCSYIYNGLPADKNVCKSHCFIDPDSSIHSFFYSFINSILKLFCFYSFITFIILHLHRKPSLFQLAACFVKVFLPQNLDFEPNEGALEPPFGIFQKYAKLTKPYPFLVVISCMFSYTRLQRDS